MNDDYKEPALRLTLGSVLKYGLPLVTVLFFGFEFWDSVRHMEQRLVELSEQIDRLEVVNDQQLERLERVNRHLSIVAITPETDHSGHVIAHSIGEIAAFLGGDE